jgi:hypothetical protein
MRTPSLLVTLLVPTVAAAEPVFCEDLTPSADPSALADDSCVRTTPAGSFSPTIKWHWTNNTLSPGFHDIMMAPVAGNLDDDNGDGHIDSFDVPDVVFTAFTSGRYQFTNSTPGRLVILDGATGAMKASHANFGGERFLPTGGVALGDIDADGIPDICTVGWDDLLVCGHGDGTLLWASGFSRSGNSFDAPAIADMDGDGLGEVLAQGRVFDSTGNVILNLSADISTVIPGMFPVDWDLDGTLEIVAPGGVWRLDGTEVITTPHSKHAAVGDFDADGLPDLVVAQDRQIWVYRNDGSLLWTSPNLDPGANTGCIGAPTVADFDGDDLVEVGAAVANRYAVVDDDGSILWTRNVVDTSSCTT